MYPTGRDPLTKRRLRLALVAVAGGAGRDRRGAAAVDLRAALVITQRERVDAR